MTSFLYHGWANGELQGLLSEGVDPPSYWGDLATAEAYAGAGGRVLRVPVDRFEEGDLAFNEGLAVSQAEEGEDVPTTGSWQESLESFGSIRYDARLHVSEDDIVTVEQARLDEDAASAPTFGR